MAGTNILGGMAIMKGRDAENIGTRSEEHTSELQSPREIAYAVFCLKKDYSGRYDCRQGLRQGWRSLLADGKHDEFAPAGTEQQRHQNSGTEGENCQERPAAESGAGNRTWGMPRTGSSAPNSMR